MIEILKNLFLVMFFLKLSGMNASLTWFEVCSPLIFQAVYTVGKMYIVMYTKLPKKFSDWTFKRTVLNFIKKDTTPEQYKDIKKSF